MRLFVMMPGEEAVTYLHMEEEKDNPMVHHLQLMDTVHLQEDPLLVLHLLDTVHLQVDHPLVLHLDTVHLQEDQDLHLDTVHLQVDQDLHLATVLLQEEQVPCLVMEHLLEDHL